MSSTRIDSLREVLRLLFFWKRHSIFIFFIIIILVMGYAYITTPVYQATGQVVILPSTVEGAVISSGSEEYRVVEVKQQDINTEIELLYSDQVLRGTIQSFISENHPLGLRSPNRSIIDRIIDRSKKTVKDVLVFLKLVEPVSDFEAKMGLLRNSIEVEPIAMSNIIIIRLEAENAKMASVVLNRLLDTYIKHHGQVYTQDEGVDFYALQYRKFKEKLAESEKKLKDFQAQHSIIDLERQNITNIDQMAKLKEELQSIKADMAEMQNKISSLKSGLNNGVTVTREMKLIPSIAELEEALVPLYIQKSEILKNYTINSREYQNVAGQIGTIREEIKNEVKKNIATEELEYEILKARHNTLMTELDRLQAASNDISQKKKRFNELQREVELYENNYKLYSAKKEDALIFAEKTQRNLANISISSRADIPGQAHFPNRLLFLFISMFVGIAAALGSPFLLEFIDHRIKFTHDVEKYLGIPVISIIIEE